VVSRALLLLPSSARADADLNTPPHLFFPLPDQVKADTFERTATFSAAPFHVGVCRVHGATVKIRRDGIVHWKANVRSRKPATFGVRLNFLDRNEQPIFTFTWIRVKVGDELGEWTRTNLAIPQHLFPFIHTVFRNDHCDD
jgi:hypothetical protein